ncbi:bile acid:sodium symporter family protein [Nocardia farcinica]|uniref:bile acid:sodium symporter family protein n=1 Tax=Nocardia farcinica TaxID=37329 RepID=UPI001895450F|nr:bile acid:sodium symporter family protein [Nocardia farcinica]MBF6270421.1 bile acid:sodium symporter [Nocardia farcinica]MCZ9325603.1 bile acid:sodium symporter [Nocardia farcinica]
MRLAKSIDGFVLAIFATAAVAALVPAQGGYLDAAQWLVKVAIATLFLLYGMRLSPAEALAGLRHWRLHGAILSVTYLVFPVIGVAAYAATSGLIADDLRTGLLFLSLVPSTVQSSIAFTSIAGGNLPGAIVSASFSNLLGVFLTPLLVIVLLDTAGTVHIDASSVLDIVVQLLVPFLIGQLVRRWIGEWVQRHRRPTMLVDRGSILLVVYVAFSEGMNEGVWSATSPGQILLVVALCCAILAVVLGLCAVLGRVFGFAWADRIVIIFCGSKKSLATGLPMATVLFAGQPVGLIVLPLMIFHQIQLIVCAWLASSFAAKTAAGADAVAPAPAIQDSNSARPT